MMVAMKSEEKQTSDIKSIENIFKIILVALVCPLALPLIINEEE